MTLRVAFLGNHAWSVPALEAVEADPELVLDLVVTNPPRPAGRGDRLRATPVAEAARRLGVPLLEADGVAEGGPAAIALEGVAPSAIAVVAYGHLLPAPLLRLPAHGAVNLHLSLLPRWRGAAPVQHALLAGDAITGVTVMRMDEGLDTGPILAQLDDAVRPEDDAGALGARLAGLGARLLAGTIRQLPGGTLPERPQDDARVTWAPALGAADRAMAWTEPAAALVRRVRALAPRPGAVASFRGTPVRILHASVTDEEAAGPPGTIATADTRGVLVATGQGALRLRTVAPAGRRAMSAGDWARGARFAADERLG